ncbi:MAG: right-handed parallel beta-helix repeat-containing protein [Planctomycetota bacterium]|nr:right-handed parallel beta-helix repeat-containing protein [Planctomycetota bacterium]
MPRTLSYLLIAVASLAGDYSPARAAEVNELHLHVRKTVAKEGDLAASTAPDGSLEQPFQTVFEAQTEVRKQLAAGYTQPIRVIVHGRQWLSQPLVFNASDVHVRPAGAKEVATVTWQSDVAEPAILDGGTPITGWVQDGQLWKTTLADVKSGAWSFRELFVNGQRRPRARTPNEGFFRVERAGPDQRMTLFYKAGDLRAWKNIQRAEMLFMHDWSISRIGVLKIDEATRTLFLNAPVGANAPYFRIDGYEPNPRYRIENAPELLDTPGEWYLDVSSGELSYWPLPGEKIESVEAIAPRLESLMQVRGEQAAPVRGLRFGGIRFQHCAWKTPVGGYAEIQASAHEFRDGSPQILQGLVPAAIQFDFAEDCTLWRCELAHLGGTGLWFRQGCSRDLVAECKFSDIGANGINIGETTARSPEQTTNRIIVEGSEVTRAGELFFGCVGIWIGNARDIMVRNNIVHQLPYTGISVGWNWSDKPTAVQGNRIVGNHIHHIMQQLSDGAGIYTLGRQPGTRLTNNYIHDVPVNAGNAQSNGIFLDQGSSQILVDNNTIHSIAKSPIRFHMSKLITLRQNRLATPRKIPAFEYVKANAREMIMENNAVISSADWRPAASDPAAGRYLVQGTR